MTKYILIGFLSLSSLCFGNHHVSDRYPYKIQDKEFLLTFPRSGTNLTASLIQLLTKKPLGTMGRTGIFFRHSLNRLNLQLDMQKPAVHLSHCFGSTERNFFSKINTTKNKLIMTIRNPKECIIRHHRFSEEQFMHSVLNNAWGFREYVHLLQIYDKWNNASKLLIYYEDLISRPQLVAKQILNFFNEPKENLDKVFINFTNTSKKILHSYDKDIDDIKLSSRGNKAIFHSRNFSKINMQKIDHHIQSNYPHLWETYLSRYETK